MQLRAEGARHDVLAAVFAAGADDDLVRLLARTDAVAALLGTEDGANLLTAYRRAANILRIEDRKDGPHARRRRSRRCCAQPEERALGAALDARRAARSPARLAAEDSPPRWRRMAAAARAARRVLR